MTRETRLRSFGIIFPALAAVFVAESLTRSSGLPIGILPFAINTLLLVSLSLLVIAVTRRTVFSVALVLVLYTALCIANRLKIQYLLAPAHPADLFALSEIFLINLFSTSVIVAGALIAGIVLLLLVASFRLPAVKVTNAQRMFTVLLLGTLVGGSIAVGEFPRLDPRLSALGISSSDVSPIDAAEVNGILFDVLQRFADLAVEPPENYTDSKVAEVIEKLGTVPLPNAESSDAKPTLIVYIIEAMMDPLDLGVPFTADPIPFLRSLSKRMSSGWVYSPEFGGRSANAEFELLTGLSTRFLPPQSVAYNRFVSRELPALPRYLANRGYRAKALHADTLHFFNYPNVYRQLGFQEVRTLRADPKVRLDVAGRVPADDALVDLVIAEAKKQSPQFLFAFTNSTHLPYDYEGFETSTLDVAVDLPPITRHKIKTYINALNLADRAVERLVRHFEASAEPVVIAILGDHLPGLDQDGFGHAAFAHQRSFADGMALSHRCPAVIWSNVGTKKRDFELSLNFFAQRLLTEMRLPLEGFWRLNAALAAELPVFSGIVQTPEGARFLFNELPQQHRPRVEEYRVLQYDLLFGRQASLRGAQR